MVVAGLERDVDVRSSGARAGPSQRVDLRVGETGFLVVPAGDHAAFAHHQRADHRIGVRAAAPFFRLGEREAHEVLRRHFFGALLRSEISSFSSLMNSPRSLNERYTLANRT